MVTILIILGILTVFAIGFVQVFNQHRRVIKKINFAGEYRNKFIEFTNKHFQKHDGWNRSENFDNEQYIWLTLNVIKMQRNLGTFGVMDYIAPFQTYKVSNYQIVTNTIPKFRDDSIEKFDVNSVDDCLLRYLGHLEEYSKDTQKNLKNPIVWFREGFREILSIPFFILNWFGMISHRTVNSIKDSLIYKVISGLIALVALVSGIVTIIVGYTQTIEFVNRFIGN